MNFKKQLKGLTALLMVLGCMFFFNSCEDPVETCVDRDCGSGTCVENETAVDGYFCNCDAGFVNNVSDGRCTDCADGFFGPDCDSTNPCDDPNFSCPTGATCFADTTSGAFCACNATDAILSADSTACVCPEGTQLNADSTACVSTDARLKYIGVYSQTDICGPNDTVFADVATVVVSLDPNNDNQIILEDFAGVSGGHDVLASVDEDNFSIISDTYVNSTGAEVMFFMTNENEVGSFTINGDGKKVLTVNYSLQSGISSNVCVGVLTEL